MEIDINEVYSTDWDWFAVDNVGNLAHFTTAGVRALPDAVRRRKETLDLLSDYFGDLPIQKRASLENGISGKCGSDGKPLDWSTFLDMAGRGLYSYDSEFTSGPDGFYYLVARPKSAINVIDLPFDIQEALSATILPVNFAEVSRLKEVLINR